MIDWGGCRYGAGLPLCIQMLWPILFDMSKQHFKHIKRTHFWFYFTLHVSVPDTIYYTLTWIRINVDTRGSVNIDPNLRM